MYLLIFYFVIINNVHTLSNMRTIWPDELFSADVAVSFTCPIIVSMSEELQFDPSRSEAHL